MEEQQKQDEVPQSERFAARMRLVREEEARLRKSMFSPETRKALEERAAKKAAAKAAKRAGSSKKSAAGEEPEVGAAGTEAEAVAPGSAEGESAAPEPAGLSSDALQMAVIEADNALVRLRASHSSGRGLLQAASNLFEEAKEQSEAAGEALRAASQALAEGTTDEDAVVEQGRLLKVSDRAKDRVVQMRTLRSCLVMELSVLSDSIRQMQDAPLGPSPAEEAALVDLGLPKEIARAVLLAVPQGTAEASGAGIGSWFGAVSGTESAGPSATDVGKEVAELPEVVAFKASRGARSTRGARAAPASAEPSSAELPADERWKEVIPTLEVVLQGVRALRDAIVGKKSPADAASAMQVHMRQTMQDMAVSSEARVLAVS